MLLHLFRSDSRPQGAAGGSQGHSWPVQAPAPKDARRCPQGLCGKSPASTWLSSAQFIDFSSSTCLITSVPKGRKLLV